MGVKFVLCSRGSKQITLFKMKMNDNTAMSENIYVICFSSEIYLIYWNHIFITNSIIYSRMENLSQQHKNGISILIKNSCFQSVLMIAFNCETVHGHRSEQNCPQRIGIHKIRMSKRQGSVIFASIYFQAHQIRQITPLHKPMMLAELGPAISYTLCFFGGYPNSLVVVISKQ